MALSNPFNPPPNTQIVKDNPTSDSIWRRWFEQLWKRIQTGALGGTVTSVGLSLPTSVFDVTGSPVTTSGTLAATFDTQSANTAFMGPTTGAAATPAFRTLVAADIPADAVITVGVTPIASGTATRVLYEGAGNLLAEDADLTFDGTTLTAGGLSVTGNTVLGDASGDTLTINGNTATAPNNLTISRTISSGAVAVPANIFRTDFLDVSGTNGTAGALLAYTASLNLAISGNSANGHRAFTALTNINGAINQTGANPISNMTNQLVVGSGGTGATVANFANIAAVTPTINTTATITNNSTFFVQNQQNANLTTTTYSAFRVLDQTAGTLPTQVSAVRAEISSGTGKWNFLATGTANNAFTGAASFGQTTAPTAQIDVLQGTLGSAILKLASTASNDDPNEVTYQNKVTTTDATVTTIATIAIPSSTTVFIEAKVVARRTGGAAGTAEDGAAYVVDAVYKNVAGTATEIGETSIFSAEDQAGWACTFTPSGANALVQVTGAASNNVSWLITYRTYSVSS